jgi:hypothetical protein
MLHALAIKLSSLSLQPTACTSPQEVHQSSLTLVCSACQARAGPFSYKGFRQAVAGRHRNGTTGYRYTTTWSAISQSIDDNACSWCRIVRRTRDRLPADKFPPSSKEYVEVRLQMSAGRNRWGDMKIYLNGYKAATYDIYAKPGG